MKCSGCVHHRRVQWGKDIKLACLLGLYGEWLNEVPVDGGKLALAEGFGVQRRFDLGAQGDGCRSWRK
jgi:hypothetical protein